MVYSSSVHIAESHFSSFFLSYPPLNSNQFSRSVIGNVVQLPTNYHVQRSSLTKLYATLSWGVLDSERGLKVDLVRLLFRFMSPLINYQVTQS